VPTGTWRVRAFTDPKGSSVGETTFMVEDYIPERIEFDLSSKDKQIKADSAVELKVNGHFLYGAPASGLQVEGDMLVAPASSRPGFAGYQFGRCRRGDHQQRADAIENLPEADANGVANLFPSALAKQPTSTRPQEAQIFIRMAEAGGRAVERKTGAAGRACGGDDRGQAAVRRQKRPRRADKAAFDVRLCRPRWQAAGARRGCATSC